GTNSRPNQSLRSAKRSPSLSAWTVAAGRREPQREVEIPQHHGAVLHPGGVALVAVRERPSGGRLVEEADRGLAVGQLQLANQRGRMATDSGAGNRQLARHFSCCRAAPKGLEQFPFAAGEPAR